MVALYHRRSQRQRQAAGRPERSRVRCAWGVLVYGLWQGPAARHGPGVCLLRQGGRQYLQRSYSRHDHPKRHRSVTGRLPPLRGHLLVGVPGYQEFDSLAVDSAGYVCVATLHNGGITAISPDGTSVEHVPLPDPVTTNICFGGGDLRTAYITLSQTGRLVALPWPRPGLVLHYQQR